MPEKIILQKTIDIYMSGKYSAYLLLDNTVKELLSRNLQIPVDADKHTIKLEIRENSKGQIFAAFWFIEK